MKRLFQIGLLLCIAVTVTAQENQKTLKVYDWKDLAGQIPNSQIISMDGMQVLKIEITNQVPLKVSLLTVTNSSLIQKVSTLEWEMKCENVPAFGYAFLLEKFSPRVLGGDDFTNFDQISFLTKNWDKYNIHAGGHKTLLHEFEFSLFFKGTVYLRPIKLLGVAKTAESWWPPEQKRFDWRIGGSLIGCFGGLIGWLVSKGKARKFVLSAAASAIVLGILLTIAGLVAAILKQPYSVWYALLFPGVILVLVFSLNLHSIQRRYDELEIRRMTSVDAMRS